jgi:hypothetical protein
MFYLVPVVPIRIGLQTFNGPKYSDTDFPGAGFSAIPYGLEGITLLSLDGTNAALQAEPDVFTFPDDLTTSLTDQDVSNIDAYFLSANIPSDFATVGMLWSDVLRTVAQIFLVAEAISGATGASIFPAGITPDSPVVLQTQQFGKTGNQASPTPTSAVAQVIGGQAGVFDLSDAQATDTISDVLTSIGQQFTAEISFDGVTV